jgi:hypothetical protein
LDRYNKNLLDKESDLIQKIGLQEEKIKSIMKDKRDKYFYSYFRNNLFRRSMVDFFLLPIKSKIILIKYIFKVLIDKITGTFRGSQFFLNK